MPTVQQTSGIPIVKGTEMLFGEFLVSKNLINRHELGEALAEQRDRPGRLGEILIRLKKLSSEKVTQALAEHLGIEHVRLDDISKNDLNVARLLPESISSRFCLV
ncbi:MAG: hypothetical protein WC962_05475, partial [Phycisphaerae bacterium]